MKQSIFYFITALVIISLFSSCKIEKRRYTKGYYHHHQKFILKSSVTMENEVISDAETEVTINSEPEKTVFADSICSTSMNTIETINEKKTPEIDKVYSSDVIIENEITLSLSEESPLENSDTIPPKKRVNNEKINEDAEFAIEDALFGLAITTLAVILGFVMVFSPSIGLVWLLVFFFLGGIAGVCYAFVNIIRLLVFLRQGWLNEKQKSKLLILGIWFILAFLLACIMLFALFGI